MLSAFAITLPGAGASPGRSSERCGGSSFWCVHTSAMSSSRWNTELPARASYTTQARAYRSPDRLQGGRRSARGTLVQGAHELTHRGERRLLHGWFRQSEVHEVRIVAIVGNIASGQQHDVARLNGAMYGTVLVRGASADATCAAMRIAPVIGRGPSRSRSARSSSRSWNASASTTSAATRRAPPAATADTCDDARSSTPSLNRRTSEPTAQPAAAGAADLSASTRDLQAEERS